MPIYDILDKIVSIMPRKIDSLLPSVKRHLQDMGENIRLARLRRRLSASLTASRAGISRPTLRAIERGDPKVTLGAYAIVLMTLGLDKELANIARNDILGRKLQDVNLPVRARAPRAKMKVKLPHEPG